MPRGSLAASAALALIAVLVMPSASWAAPTVTAREVTLTLPTYPLGPPSPHAPVFRERVYPYAMQTRLGRKKVSRRYRAIVLQNAHLRVEIVPALGGKVYGAFDRHDHDRAFIYRNSEVKPGLVALRGAWASGGLEWNFPSLGHSTNTFSPVPYAIVRHADGAVSLVVGTSEWVRRMRWVVWITLRPDETRLLERARLSNPRPIAQRAYYWVNGAVAEPSDTVVHFSPRVRHVFDGGRHSIQPWPLYRRHDRSRVATAADPSELFAAAPSDFVAAYSPSRDRGTVHASSGLWRPGKKYWTWGTAGEGKLWQRRLTDTSGPYLEIQAGQLPTQLDTWIFEPLGVETSQGVWYPLRGLGGLTTASADAALHVQRRPGSLEVALLPTRSIAAGRLTLSGDGRVQTSRAIILRAGQPLRVTLPLAAASTHQLELFEGQRRLSSYRFPVIAAPPARRLAKPPQAKDAVPPAASADELYRLARAHYLAWRRERARGLLQRAQRVDAQHARTLRLLARLELQRGDFAVAARYLERLLAKQPNDLSARYLRALAHYGETPRVAAAALVERDLWPLLHRTSTGQLAARLAAGMALRRGRPAAAERWLLRALRHRPASPMLQVALAALEARRGAKARAWKQLDAVLRLDPLHPPALLLAAQLGRPPAAARLLADPQPYLEAAHAFRALALDAEAVACLRAYRRRAPKRPHPIVELTLAFWLAKGTKAQKGEADRLLRAAGRRPARGIFPFRHETRTVLRWAHGRVGARGRWRLENYLGLLDLAQGYPLRGRRWLERAALGRPTFAPLYLLLARLAQRAGQRREALRFAQRAVALDRDDEEAFVLNDELLAQASSAGARRRLLARASARLRQTPAHALRRAVLAVAERRFDAALAALAGHTFPTWELGGRDARAVWLDALRGRAREHLARRRWAAAIKDLQQALRWPERLGAGRPADPDETVELHLLGVGYRALGQRAKARAAFLRAAAPRAGRAPASRCARGRALAALGQSRAARGPLASCKPRRP